MPKQPETVSVHLRLPLALKEQIDKAADAEGRSINSEVVRRLRASFEERKGDFTISEIEDAVRKVMEAMPEYRRTKR